jgi:hypothetical protein
MAYKSREVMLMADKVKSVDIPTAFMSEVVFLTLGIDLCCDSMPVQTLEFILIDDGEEQVAVSLGGPHRRHDDSLISTIVSE